MLLSALFLLHLKYRGKLIKLLYNSKTGNYIANLVTIEPVLVKGCGCCPRPAGLFVSRCVAVHSYYIYLTLQMSKQAY